MTIYDLTPEGAGSSRRALNAAVRVCELDLIANHFFKDQNTTFDHAMFTAIVARIIDQEIKPAKKIGN